MYARHVFIIESACLWLEDVNSNQIQRGWAVRDGAVHFSAKNAAEEEAAAIPALGLINNALTYARELERIV